jgi:hypothetical protein
MEFNCHRKNLVSPFGNLPDAWRLIFDGKAAIEVPRELFNNRPCLSLRFGCTAVRKQDVDSALSANSRSLGLCYVFRGSGTPLGLRFPRQRNFPNAEQVGDLTGLIRSSVYLA